MEITAQRLKELERIEMKMRALEAGGVDNWDFYGEALTKYHEEIKNEDKIEEAFNDILESLCSAIEEPAGRGCGYGFRPKEADKSFKILKDLIKEIKK